MRILFTSNPLYGHVNTVLPLARAAQRAGHDVTLATGADLVEHVRSQGVAAWAVGPTRAGTGPATDWIDYFVSAAGKRAVEMVPWAVDQRPDLVVSEETELAGPVAAAAARAAHVVHGLGLMPPMQIWQALAPAVDALGRQWDAPDLAGRVRAATYLDVCPPALQPGGARIWPHSRPVRPSAGSPGDGRRLPDAVAALPYDRTVHLTLGTVFHENTHVLETALRSLRVLPANLVVTTGPGLEPDRFGPQPAHVLIEPYLPHALLLPRCTLVVSQGGAGVLFGALAHGIPQLVLPQGAEQFLNADACRRAGAALVLGPDEVTPAAIAASAVRLLTEGGFTASARHVRSEIEAMPDADTALAQLLATDAPRARL